MTARDSARALLALLAGQSSSSSSMSMSPADLQALQRNARDGDEEARLALPGVVQQRTLAGRVAAAVADDTAIVIVADGSQMPRAEAERHLAHKEERRVYPSLRLPLLKARRQALDPAAVRFAFDQALRDTGTSPALPASSAGALAALRAFLAASTGMVAPALDILASVAHGAVDDAHRLVRALDLPDPARFNDSVIIELVRGTRESLPRDARPLQRRPAPRLLAGHVVDDGAVVRLLVAPSLAAGRSLAMARGVGVAYARLADVDVGSGLGLTLSTPAIRRLVGLKGDAAEQLWRHAVCASFLEARLGAAIAVAVADGLASAVDPEAPPRDVWAAVRDQARAAARSAVSFDAGAELVDDRLLPPWPDGVDDDDVVPAVAAVRAALAAAVAAADALAIRDIDDGVLLRRHGLVALMEAAPVVAVDEGRGTSASVGWQTLLGEVA
jgi:hypothetical protein